MWSEEASGEPLRGGEGGWEESCLGSTLKAQEAEVRAGLAVQGLMPYGQVFDLNL